MEQESLARLGAAEAARRIADAQITSTELVTACLARIEEVEPAVKAWIRLDPEHALAQAGALDEARETGLPCGPLHGVPFHALPAPGETDNEPVPLGAPRAVFYAPSMQAVVRWLGRQESQAAGVLALANPHGNLPFATKEACAVMNVVGDGRLLEGPQATDAALKAYAPEARYIHLAAHAEWGGPGNRAVLHLASEEAKTGADSHGSETAETDRERETKTSQELRKGDVDAAAIAGLALDAELVVASACESGAGELTRTGEGPSLLSWAFLTAGARSIVAASWELEDKVTAELMTRFYEYLAHGASKVNALRRAQQDVATASAHVESGQQGQDEVSCSPGDANRSHPYYWAGFFLTGDWR